MSRIALLVGDRERITEGNYRFFSDYLLARGDEVSLALIDSLAMHDTSVSADMVRLDAPLVLGSYVDDMPFERGALERMDLVWILALGLRPTFLDKMQLLHNLSHDVRVINSVESLLFLKSKYLLAHAAELFRYPETYASADWEYLWNIVSASDNKWVLKPAAGSFGRDVFIVTRHDTNVRPLLQNMTANGKGQYCILQRYAEEIRDGEKRVLLANGLPVGQYRRSSTHDHRTNVEQGATPSACDLTPEERDLCANVGRYLRETGALFAGIDLVYPYVIEVNVVNPGGIESVLKLTGENLTGAVVESILEPSA